MVKFLNFTMKKKNGYPIRRRHSHTGKRLASALNDRCGIRQTMLSHIHKYQARAGMMQSSHSHPSSGDKALGNRLSHIIPQNKANEIAAVSFSSASSYTSKLLSHITQHTMSATIGNIGQRVVQTISF